MKNFRLFTRDGMEITSIRVVRYMMEDQLIESTVVRFAGFGFAASDSNQSGVFFCDR